MGINCAGKKALILGSGGASVTVQSVLHQLGAQTVVISRSGAHNYQNLDQHGDAAILVNATPVGMYPDNEQSPLSLSCLPRLEAVCDLIYNPARTRLLLDAEARGIACTNGLYMLVAQAAGLRSFLPGNPFPGKFRRQLRPRWELIWRIGSSSVCPAAGKAGPARSWPVALAVPL